MAYQNLFAEYYDLFYAEKDYNHECSFIIDCLNRFSQKKTKDVLELACGTGTHSTILARHGFNITATDISADMLKVAQNKVRDKDLAISFQQMDMVNFSPFNRSFDAILCLFDSIGYAKTNEAIGKVFSNVFAHLSKNGMFIFEFWSAGAMLRSHDPVREKFFLQEGKKIKRTSRTSIDYFRQLAVVDYTISSFENENEKLMFRETHENRYFMIQEMNLFITQGGFENLGFFSGFNFNGTVDENTWHVVAVCRKPS